MLAGISAVFLVLVIVTSVSLYLGWRPLGPSTLSSAIKTTIVTIPQGSFDAPLGFTTPSLLNGSYHYLFNFTVVVGVNNTVKWVNNDKVEHNVSSFLVPPGAATFDSDLIQPHDNYSVTLTVPGVYKYTCIWHPWLAGEITVKA